MKDQNEWRAVKYPDSKTWSVVGTVSIAKGIKEQADAELLASAPRLQQRVNDMSKDLEYLTEKLKEETGRKHKLLFAIESIYEYAGWHSDDEADENNPSPEDMAAHINGLIRQKCRQVLDHNETTTGK